MNLNPQQFRTLPEDFFRNISMGGFAIRDLQKSPLILIKASGLIEWGGSKEKDDLLKKYMESEGDVMLFAWAGQFRTDMFRVTAADLKRGYFSQHSATSVKPEKKKQQLAELQSLVDGL